MRLKELVDKILFEGRTQPLNGVMQAKEIYQSRDFSQYSFANRQIFRGIENGPDYGYIEPSKFDRQSAHTKNYYTLILDNSDNWSEYPKRSKSIVCSTGQIAPSNYGDIYLVIPQGTPNIAIAPAKDIWFAFESGLNEVGLDLLADLNEVIDSISKIVLDNVPPEKDYKSFVRFINRLEDKGKKTSEFEHIAKKQTDKSGMHHLPKESSFLSNYLNQNRSLYKFLEYLLDPEKNNFKLKKYKIPFNAESNREVWMSVPALLIKRNKWDEFFEETIGQKTPFKK